MNPTSLPFANDNAPHRTAGDLINDYRARRALEEEERAQRRRIDLEEQQARVAESTRRQQKPNESTAA